jgi:hypothetical protein
MILPDTLPAPPESPEQEHCCGRGCHPCVFDYYEDRMADWEGKVRAAGLAPEEILASLKYRRVPRPPWS